MLKSRVEMRIRTLRVLMVIYNSRLQKIMVSPYPYYTSSMIFPRPTLLFLRFFVSILYLVFHASATQKYVSVPRPVLRQGWRPRAASSQIIHTRPTASSHRFKASPPIRHGILTIARFRQSSRKAH